MTANKTPAQPSPGSSGSAPPLASAVPPVVIQTTERSSFRKWMGRLILLLLLFSLLVNFGMYARYQQYFGTEEPPYERYESGSREAKTKIALLEMKGTIMPPFTERFLKVIRRVREDEDVRAAVLVVDSPGGLVADSHKIYHALQKLRQKKPVLVVMQRMAASGGYYISMGAGPRATIYAEPTSWVGSIGVIIPRFNARVLAVEKLGIRSESLTTGPFKDSLNPLRDLRPEEYQLWQGILADAFDRFLDVVADNRPTLSRRDVRLLGWNAGATLRLQQHLREKPEKTVEFYATGRIFTARQAMQAGLIDKLGYVDDAIEELKQRLKIGEARVVRYEQPFTLFSLLSGAMKAHQPERQWEWLCSLTVPQPLYYCSGLPLILPTRSGAE